jgi:hypothetical protein
MRLADLLGGLSIVADLGFGLPPETAMRSCLIGTALARELDVAEKGSRRHLLHVPPAPRRMQEGELTAYLPGVSRVLRRGECMNQPAGVPQTHSVTSPEPARVLAVNSPAGFERFVAEAGRPAESLTLPPPEQSPPDLERLAAIAAEHGMEFLGPPGTLP